MAAVPVVYLDQTHWVTLARARFSPDKVTSPVELDAAKRLWQAAEGGQVRLPLSMGHLVETERRGDKTSRTHLADTMLDVYGGWHMRHPLDIRRAELAWGLRGGIDELLSASDVFSTSPDSPFSANDTAPYVCEEPHFSESQRRMVEQYAWLTTWVTLLREEKLSAHERANADAVVTGWAQTHADLATYIAGNPSNRDMRVVAACRTFADLHHEIASLAKLLRLPPSEILPRISLQSHGDPDEIDPDGLVRFFARLPFLGRVSDVLYQRLRNPQEQWVRNDLTDLMYLCCAAGYADFVVAEKATAHRLVSAEPRTTPGAFVVKNLRGLSNHLTL